MSHKRVNHSVKVAVTITSYNDQDRIGACIESVLWQETGGLPIEMMAVVTDDGSSDATPQILLQYEQSERNVYVSLQPHKERGAARLNAISHALELKPDYLLIIDSDMILKPDLIRSCVEAAEAKEAGAIMVPEYAYSESRNFMTQVKVFERNILNNSGDNVSVDTSIEAARFWRTDAFVSTGGFHKDQIAFEEIQPTIRYREMGGTIGRTIESCLLHDEKHVTLKGILDKKRYYFSKLHITAETESKGFVKMLQRWYFFRPVLYRPSNLLRYFTKPHLTVGMFFMYFMLTWIAVMQYTKPKGLAPA